MWWVYECIANRQIQNNVTERKHKEIVMPRKSFSRQPGTELRILDQLCQKPRLINAIYFQEPNSIFREAMLGPVGCVTCSRHYRSQWRLERTEPLSWPLDCQILCSLCSETSGVQLDIACDASGINTGQAQKLQNKIYMYFNRYKYFHNP